MKHTLAACVVTLLVASATSAHAQQADPFVGTWKQNLAKSTYDPASLTPKSGTTVKRAASGKGYKLTADAVSAQGAATHTEYTAATLDGKDYPLTGSKDYDSVALTRIDANTLITVDKKGGAVVRMLRTTVSKDGKTTTSVSVGYNSQGVAFHVVTVFDKQ
jgi:hypothetical protein